MLRAKPQPAKVTPSAAIRVFEGLVTAEAESMGDIGLGCERQNYMVLNVDAHALRETSTNVDNSPPASPPSFSRPNTARDSAMVVEEVDA